VVETRAHGRLSLTHPGETPRPAALLWHYAENGEALRRVRREYSGWRPEALGAHGLTAATVVDVGAATGTPDLYRSFPDAHLVLVDPLVEHERPLRNWADRRGEYHLLALGERQGTLTMNVLERALGMSSALTSIIDRTREEPVSRQVDVTTLDTLYEQRRWTPPFGLKIDTEGYEDRVLKGARRTLAETQFVIAEVSVARRFEGGHSFAQLIALLDEAGFALTDVLDGLKWSHSGEMIFMDALFRRCD